MESHSPLWSKIRTLHCLNIFTFTRHVIDLYVIEVFIFWRSLHRWQKCIRIQCHVFLPSREPTWATFFLLALWFSNGLFTPHKGRGANQVKGRRRWVTWAKVNKHPPWHQPLKAYYYSSCGWTSTELIFGFTLVTNSVRRSHVYVDRWNLNGFFKDFFF
jgi:hypothetical protein